MQPLSRQDKVKVGGALALILICVFAIYQMYMSQQIHIVKQVWLPPGSSEKGQAMKRQGVSVSDNIDPSKIKSVDDVNGSEVK